MERVIELDKLLQYPLRRGSEHCDEEHANPHFLNGVESVLEWAQTLPIFTLQNEPGLACTLEDTAGTLAELQEENAYMRDLLRLYCGCKVCANALMPMGCTVSSAAAAAAGTGLSKKNAGSSGRQRADYTWIRTLKSS